MIETDVHFYSETNRLEATVYRPDDLEKHEVRPALIVNSGYQGFNEFYPRMFAQNLTRRGFICIGFDYRGMAASEGESGRVLIEEQVQDIRNAVTFAETQDGVDLARIGLIGWGMGAPAVLLAAEQCPRVAAVAGLNGFYNGERWLKSIHSYEKWLQIRAEVENDRRHRVLNGRSQTAETFIHYPLDPATKSYVEQELSSVPGFGADVQLQFTESVMELDAERAAAGISPRPLFIAHGRDNVLHPVSEAQSLYANANSPKTLYLIDGKHNDFMFSEAEEFLDLCDHLTHFFRAAEAQCSGQTHISE